MIGMKPTSSNESNRPLHRRGRFLICFALVLATLTGAQADGGRFTGGVRGGAIAVGPDRNLDLFMDSLTRAQDRIWINIYQVDQEPVIRLLERKLQSNVEVKILLETEPCCTANLSNAGFRAALRLAEALQRAKNPRSRIFFMRNMNKDSGTTPKPPNTRRYPFNHAKYALIDAQTVWMASENLTTSGHALPGLTGNRGWDVVLDDATLARQLSNVFISDSNTSQDIITMKSSDPVPAFIANARPGREDDEEKVTSRGSLRSFPIISVNITDADLIAAPNAVDPVVNWMRRSSRTLDLQFMSLPTKWTAPDKTPVLSRLVATLLERAAAGTRIRVLLNDDRVWDGTTNLLVAKKNELTVAYLNRQAACRRLNLEARVIDAGATGITYIHNKGMIGDNARVLVSSINGTQNSIESNRETALALDTREGAALLSDVFNWDWSRSPDADRDVRTQAARDANTQCDSLRSMPLAWSAESGPRLFLQ